MPFGVVDGGQPPDQVIVMATGRGLRECETPPGLSNLNWRDGSGRTTHSSRFVPILADN